MCNRHAGQHVHSAIECSPTGCIQRTDKLHFRVCSGTLGEVAWPEVAGLRVDTWVAPGSVVSHNFDSLIAKVMVHAPSRDEATRAMLAALAGTRVKGIPTNMQLMQAVLRCDEFTGGLYDTHLLLRLKWAPCYAEVRQPQSQLFPECSGGVAAFAGISAAAHMLQELRCP